MRSQMNSEQRDAGKGGDERDDYVGGTYLAEESTKTDAEGEKRQELGHEL